MHAEHRALAERLIRFWSRSNLDIRPGADEAALLAFERDHGLVLPEDLREYFLVVDGMAPGQLDPVNYFRFWPLAEIAPVEGQVASGYFEFADVSIQAYIYAIRLTRESGRNSVGVVEDGNVREVADSFSDFAKAYLDEPSRLF